MPMKVEQAESSIKKMQDAVIDSQKKALTQIREQAKMDTEKLLKVETQMRYLSEVIDKVNSLNQQVHHLTPLRLQMNDTRTFIERQLPILIHLQVMEGLHVGTLGLEKVREFERARLAKLKKYAADGEGTESQI
jgi:hypothetical protein